MSTTKIFNSSQSGKLQSSENRITEDCLKLLYDTFHSPYTHKWDDDGNLIIDHKDS